MRKAFIVALGVLPLAASAFAQTAPSTALRITVDDAVRMAVEHNVDLAAARLTPQIGDTVVAAAAGAFVPTFASGLQRHDQRQPGDNFLSPTAVRTSILTSSAGIGQRLPWFGTSYNLSWDSSHTESNSFLNSYDPLLLAGLRLNISQPLMRDFGVDGPRHQLAVSHRDRDIADLTLREQIVRTTASVKTAYWNLVSARATVDARMSALRLAEELMRVNAAKVGVGQSPALDLLTAQAEVAANREQVVIAETAARAAEDRLRVLVFDTTDRGVWSEALDPIDMPAAPRPAVDVDAAIAHALNDRTDLGRARKEIEKAGAVAKFAGNQRLPDVRLNLSYQANGLGGTQVLRAGGFPGTIAGRGDNTDFGSVLNQVFQHDYPTWTAGVSVGYPIGGGAEKASHARARLEQTQAQRRVQSAEAQAIQQVRDAARKIDMNLKRMESTRLARELAEQRLDAERKRFDVGMSTSFLVIQAQRDLARARTSELDAVLAYDLSLVDFDAVQEAGPVAGQSSSM